jgi:hypothetical protein
LKRKKQHDNLHQFLKTQKIQRQNHDVLDLLKNRETERLKQDNEALESLEKNKKMIENIKNQKNIKSFNINNTILKYKYEIKRRQFSAFRQMKRREMKELEKHEQYKNNYNTVVADIRYRNMLGELTRYDNDDYERMDEKNRLYKNHLEKHRYRRQRFYTDRPYWFVNNTYAKKKHNFLKTDKKWNQFF